MLERAGAAGCNDRDLNGVGHLTREFQIVAILRPIGIHAGQQDFARAEFSHDSGPFNGVTVCSYAAAMRVDLSATFFPSRIDSDDDALTPKAFRRFLHNVRVLHGRRIQGYLVCTATQDLLNVINRPQAATHREGNIDAVRHARHHSGDDISPVRRSRNIEKYELVRALIRISKATLDGITGIAQVYEMDTFHNTSVLYIETRDDPLSEHRPMPPQFNVAFVESLSDDHTLQPLVMEFRQPANIRKR